MPPPPPTPANGTNIHSVPADAFRFSRSCRCMLCQFFDWHADAINRTKEISPLGDEMQHNDTRTCLNLKVEPTAAVSQSVSHKNVRVKVARSLCGAMTPEALEAVSPLLRQVVCPPGLPDHPRCKLSRVSKCLTPATGVRLPRRKERRSARLALTPGLSCLFLLTVLPDD